MNDLSMHPIKKCQSLYSAENEVKMGFVLQLINIYDGTRLGRDRGALCVWMPELLDVIVCWDIYQWQYFVGPSQGQREL